MRAIPTLTDSDKRRFKAKVGEPIKNGCCEWTGSKNAGGYGTFNINGHPYLASRVAAAIAGIDLSGNSQILHECDNPPCVNTSHLTPGTQKQNQQAMARRKRQVFQRNPEKCPRGETHHQAKLNSREVLKIRRIHASRRSTRKAIALQFKVSLATIKAIIAGKIWAHL